MGDFNARTGNLSDCLPSSKGDVIVGMDSELDDFGNKRRFSSDYQINSNSKLIPKHCEI